MELVYISDMIKAFIFLLLISIHFTGSTQTEFEFGYSFGANGTTSRTIKSDNMTWGYYTPPFPVTWSNHWYFGWGNKKNKVYGVFDSGGLGPMFRVKAYPNKYPYDDAPSNGDTFINYSRRTKVQGQSRTNSNLIKLSLLYKHKWNSHNKFHHKSIFGVGYLKTRTTSGQANFGTLFFADSTIGIISHSFVMDRYEYFRNQNFYLSAGYEFSYDFGEKWSWNASIIYNQGLYKMIRWHTFREYSESLTGYYEYDEQWSFTRLSYFSFLTGVSYTFNFKKKD